MTAETLRETSTGYLTTTLTRTATGEHTVVRRPGADRPHRDEPSEADLAQVARAAGASSRVSPGVRVGEAWQHTVPGPASLALLLSAGMRAEPLERVAAALGTTLAAVHSRTPAPTFPEPSGLSRLRAWSLVGPRDDDTRDTRYTRDTRRALDTVAEALGADGLDTLLRDLDTEGAPAATLLGAPGSQTVHPDPAGGPATVLVTDEVASGAPSWDLGWFVGELVERATTSTGDPETLARASRALLGAYARVAEPVDPHHVAAAAAARVLVHVHDYATYVGWDASLAGRARSAAGLRPGVDPALVERWCAPP